MLELLNQNEIKRVVEATKPCEQHVDLLAALRDRYPLQYFNLVATREWFREGGIVDGGGRRLADSYEFWLRAEFEATGGVAEAVWEKYRDAGLVFTKWRGDTIYFTIPFGAEPEDFFQLEVKVSEEVMDAPAFGDWIPNSFEDLLLSSGDYIKPQVVTFARYCFVSLWNIRQTVREEERDEMTRRHRDLPAKAAKIIRRNYIVPDQVEPVVEEIPFLEAYPDWLTRPVDERRLLQDWKESSAGLDGHLFCRHWFFRIASELVEREKVKRLIPAWADSGGGMELPVLRAADFRSVGELKRALEKFDRRAGHPFAWFFYMLHGNRIRGDIGDRMAEGVKSGEVGLPASDEEVLLRWREDRYGF